MAETAGQDDEARSWELVSIPEKPHRRSGYNAYDPEKAMFNTGTPSFDGNRVHQNLFAGVLADGEFSYPYDYVTYERDAKGWTARSLVTAPLHGAVISGTGITPHQFSPDLTHSFWTSSLALVTSEDPWGQPPPLGTSGDYTRYADERGFRRWIRDPAQLISTQTDAEFSRNGSAMVRWGAYRGMLAPGNDATLKAPPAGLQPGNAGGKAIYSQRLATGENTLINECTGTGAAATRVPHRQADGKLVAGPCEWGNVVSRHGAIVGGGNEYAHRVGTMAATAVSSDGSSVYFQAPDIHRSNQPPNATAGCVATQVGEMTVCQPQLFLSNVGDDGKRRVRWVSRPEFGGQDATLLGRGAGFQGASRDGRVVYFQTNAPLTADDPNCEPIPDPPGDDPRPILTGNACNSSWDLYRYELPEDGIGDGTLTRVSGGPTGDADPNVACSGLTSGECNATALGGSLRYLSADGSKAYFVTVSPIEGVASNTNPDNGGTTVAEGDPTNNINSRNLYLFDSDQQGADRWRFIANLPHPGTRTANTMNIDFCASSYSLPGHEMSTTGTDVLTNSRFEHHNCVRGNTDGTMIAFLTSKPLTADDLDANVDVYVFDAEQNRLSRASKPLPGETGYQCVTQDAIVCNANFGASTGGPSGIFAYRIRQFNVTDDKSVYFQSQARLDSRDNNELMDVYRWSDGEVSLFSSGKPGHASVFSGNSEDGSSVFIYTSEPLDSYREVDAADFDLYVSRAGGGFPPPTEPIPCSLMDSECHRYEARPGPVAANPSAIPREAENASGKPERCTKVRNRYRRAARQLRVKRARIRVSVKRARRHGAKSVRQLRQARRTIKRQAAQAKRLRSRLVACQSNSGGNR